MVAFGRLRGTVPSSSSSLRRRTNAPGNANAGQGSQENQTPQEEDGLKDYWADILGPRPETIEQRLIREFGVHAGRLTIANNHGDVIVAIDPDGSIQYGEGIAPNEAAEAFWTSLALKRPLMEERLHHFAIMEATLVRLGRATLNYQQRLIASEAPTAGPEERELAERARMNLNSLVGNLTDYAAGLALRPIEGGTPPEGRILHQTPAQRATLPANGNPGCRTCEGSGHILGDCADSPNIWYDPCPTCRPNPNCPECHGAGVHLVVNGRPSLEDWTGPCPACRRPVDQETPDT
jgi:hypothetical protein